MNSNTGDGFDRQQKTLDEIAGDHKRLRLAFERFVEFLHSQKPVGKPKTQQDAISWLMTHMQTAETLPTMSEISRLAGIPRRQLTRDRWPRFYDTYHRIRGLQKGVDKARMVTAHEDGEE